MVLHKLHDERSSFIKARADVLLLVIIARSSNLYCHVEGPNVLVAAKKSRFDYSNLVIVGGSIPRVNYVLRSGMLPIGEGTI